MFQTPQEAARDAVASDVHVIGVSTQAAGHKTLVPELRAALAAEGGDDILIVCGGVIPAQDYDYLKANGAAAIFGNRVSLDLDLAKSLQLDFGVEAQPVGRSGVNGGDETPEVE